MRKRIAVLRSDDYHHIYLSRLLQSRFEVTAVVTEPARHQRRRLFRRRRYKDYAYNLYHLARRDLLGLNAYRKTYFADLLPPTSRACRRLTVDSINENRVVALLEELHPDLTVIICTSILRKKTIRAAGTVINVHGGFLPYYRGNYCFFFPFYRKEFDKIGSTLHFVNAGIDTGDIIENVVPPIYPDDTPEKLYCRAEKLAIHRLADWIAYWEKGGDLPRQPQSEKFPLHRTRDHKPHHDLWLWLRRISGRHRVPSLPGVPLAPIELEEAEAVYAGEEAPGSESGLDEARDGSERLVTQSL